MIQCSIKISWHPHHTIYPWEELSVRVRGHQHREYAVWSCVLDCGRETEVSRSTDKISKSLSKWSQLRGKSCHLAREEWFFYSTRQFFKEIASLCRNSSILNDELRTIKVNFQTEKQRDFRCSWWEIKENRQEQDSRVTKDQYSLAPEPFPHQDFFVCIQFVFDSHVWAFLF